MHLKPPFIRRSFSEGGQNNSIKSSPAHAGLFYNISLREKNGVKLTKVNNFSYNKLTTSDLLLNNNIFQLMVFSPFSGFTGNFVNNSSQSASIYPVSLSNCPIAELAHYLCTPMQETKSIAFHTLGCKLNFSETSTLGRMMEQEGFEKKAFEEEADVYVINTCSVTENADKECRQIVRRIQRRAPEAMVVITGCYAQLKPHEIAEIEGVDLVLGAAEKFNLHQHLHNLTKSKAKAEVYSCDIETLEGFHSSWSVNDRTRVFLKVQDGCDYNCSFCTIPLARGHSRSDSIAGVLANVEELAKAGTKEIVLTGINLGDFGKGNEGGKKREESFLELIQALDEVEGIERFRISSIEPNLLTNDVIEFVAQSKRFMPHFHIPLQSGSKKILGLMRRRYVKELYAERVARIKELMPHCCIGVDVIVGFPSETEEDFKETFDFLHELDISYLHVFTYSERPNTLAIEMEPVVPVHTRQQRNKILRNLSYQKMQYFSEQHNGKTRKVLFEHADKNGMMDGYTDNYIKVSTPYRPEWANEVIDWQLS